MVIIFRAGKHVASLLIFCIMRKWIVTIKEVERPKPITTTYVGDVDREFVEEFFGCNEPDVEWYKIEEEK